MAAIVNQLGTVIKSQSVARKTMLLAIIVASVVGMIFLALRAQTGGQVTLFSGMQPGDAFEAMAKLRQIGIDAKLEGGTTIKVPRNKFDDAAVMLSMEGLPGSGVVGFELMDKSSVGQSRFQQEKNYHRMREGELSRTLLAIREIERARVHLALPEDSNFIKEQKPATASVMLKIRRGMSLSSKQIGGIIHLVSHSIEGLNPDDVAIIDDLGNPLNPAKVDDSAQAQTAMQGMKMEYEEVLKNRIETMLENVAGKGRVSARVQADFDFSTLRQVKQTYNPEEQDPIKKSEKTSQEGVPDKTVAGGGPAGAPGSSSNLPAANGGAAGGKNVAQSGPNSATRTDNTTEYLVSSMQSESQQTAPTLKRVSVAVLVDEIYDEATKQYRPATQQELTNYEELVKNTIGYNAERQDAVTVKCTKFRIETPADEKESFFNYSNRQLIQIGVEWGIVGFIGLLLILLVLRPAVKQILVTPVAGGMQGLPAGAGAGALAAQLAGGESGNALPGGVNLAQLPNGAAKGGNIPNSNKSLEDLMNDLSDDEIPEELKGNQEAIRAFKLQRLAAQQARLTQAQTQQMQKEVIETAKSNPQKTVSLLRQWMDEA